ncbi:uncharacterized protein LOC135108543 [Scylla paramamosain]|uniref:uncharacterized protein LOC135108543 n=1 Tax=Scylla paramamosain TaxID=85552 RepID=UPI003083B76B
MKTAASASRALTLLAVVLLGTTLLMNTAEAHRGRPRPPATLRESLVRCLCEVVDDDCDGEIDQNACITCFDSDTATLEEIFACLDTAGIDRTIAAACTERQRSSCHSSEERG